ncbi:MAG: tyrosine/phenylalanine carboxypeptidase domain-containing protein [Patescibacteria group bacterium]
MKRNEYITKYAVDHRWFLALKEIRAPLLLRSYRLADDVVTNGLSDFLANPNRNPIPVYRYLDCDRIADAVKRLNLLRKQIVQEEADFAIRDIYTQKTEEMLLELSLQQATCQEDWDEFNHINRLLFGDLEPEIVSDICIRLSSKYESFGKQKCKASSLTFLRQAITPNLQEKVRASLITSLLEIDGDHLYEAEEICGMWSKKLPPQAMGWKVVLSDEVVGIKVSSRHRRVYIPRNFKAPGKKVARLFAHEVGVHVLRRVLGKERTLQLFAIGLPGYAACEEGLGILSEQLTFGKFRDFGGQDKYFTLMIALGSLDGKPKDFKDTFSYIQTYFYERVRKKYAQEKAIQISNERAWRMCWRVFRGGNPNMAGCCFLKDKMYREGNVSIWKYLVKHGELPTNAFEGKFCIQNKEHHDLLVRYK